MLYIPDMEVVHSGTSKYVDCNNLHFGAF